MAAKGEGNAAVGRDDDAGGGRAGEGGNGDGERNGTMERELERELELERRLRESKTFAAGLSVEIRVLKVRYGHCILHFRSDHSATCYTQVLYCSNSGK